MADDDDFSDFDMDVIDAAAAAYEPPESKSQRTEARKLKPLVERVLARNPTMPTSAVLKIITRSRKVGVMPTTATFNREFGRICNEVRHAHKASANKKKAGSAKAPAVPATVTPASSDTPADVTASVTVTAKAEPVPVSTPHPLSLYRGSFAGKTFVYGSEIREFFTAIQRRRDDATLKGLALTVMQIASASARLGELHRDDRAILDAALALS